MTSEVCTSPTQLGAGEQKWRTRQHAACCTLFSHPETVPSPLCQALYSRIPVESVGWWCIFETLGCYETLSRVTETDKYFPEAILQRTWEWKDFFFFLFPPYIVSITLRFACTYTIWTGVWAWCRKAKIHFAPNIYTQLRHYKQINHKSTILFRSRDFSSCNPNCPVCKAALPIGTALLMRAFM